MPKRVLFRSSESSPNSEEGEEMTDEKCEKCGSTNGGGIYCDGFGCGREECGEITYFSCYDCGHMTSFFHITALGEAVLEELLPQSSTLTAKKDEGR